jgi:hypothetical protein
MFRGGRSGHPEPMRIELFIESDDPPLGTAIAPGRTPVAFAGWLELLGVLSSLTDQPVEAARGEPKRNREEAG